eukprot:scaffold57456_cov30-Tisochrysis_lutea.AAC.1
MERCRWKRGRGGRQNIPTTRRCSLLVFLSHELGHPAGKAALCAHSSRLSFACTRHAHRWKRRMLVYELPRSSLRDSLNAASSSASNAAPVIEAGSSGSESVPERAEAARTQRRTALYLSFLQGTVPILKQQVEESRAALAAANAAVGSSANTLPTGAVSPTVRGHSPAAAPGGGEQDAAADSLVHTGRRSATAQLVSRGSKVAIGLMLDNRSSLEHAPQPPPTPPPRVPSDTPRVASMRNVSSCSSSIEGVSEEGSDAMGRWFRRGISGIAGALTPRANSHRHFARQVPAEKRRPGSKSPRSGT